MEYLTAILGFIMGFAIMFTIHIVLTGIWEQRHDEQVSKRKKQIRKIEVIERHQYARPEEVSDVRFGD